MVHPHVKIKNVTIGLFQGSFCASDSGLGVLQPLKNRLTASAGITEKTVFMPTKYQKLK